MGAPSWRPYGWGPTMADLPDEEQLLRHFEWNRELLREIAAMFVSDAPGMMRDVSGAVDHGDAPLLRQAAHKLKGSVANFRAQAAVEAALRLERIGASGDLRGARQACRALEVEVMRLRERLGEMCATPERGTSGSAEEDRG